MRPIFDLLGLFGLIVLVAAGAYWFHFKEEYELSFKSHAEIAREKEELIASLKQEMKEESPLPENPSGLEVSQVIVSNHRTPAVDGLLKNNSMVGYSQITLLGTATNSNGELIAARLVWVRGHLPPGDTTSFRFAFMDYTDEFPEGTRTTVTPLGAVTAASRPEVTRPPEIPRGRSRDPRLKDKVLGY